MYLPVVVLLILMSDPPKKPGAERIQTGWCRAFLFTCDLKKVAREENFGDSRSQSITKCVKSFCAKILSVGTASVFSWWLNASAIEQDIYIVHCTLGLGEISLVERKFNFKAGLVSSTF